MKKLNQGLKRDHHKLRWDLLPWDEVEEIVKVIHYGACKYEPDDWKKINYQFKERYFSATMRHLKAWKGGEEKAIDSGLHHLAHVACNCLFIMWYEQNEAKKKELK